MYLSSSARGKERRGGNGLIERQLTAHIGVKICPDQGDGDGDKMGWGGRDGSE